MELVEVKLQCMHMAAHLLGTNDHDAKHPTAEEVTAAAQKLYSWVVDTTPAE